MLQYFTSKHPICLRKKKELFRAPHIFYIVKGGKWAVIITKLSKITSAWYSRTNWRKLQGAFKVMLEVFWVFFPSKWIDLQCAERGQVVDYTDI